MSNEKTLIPLLTPTLLGFEILNNVILIQIGYFLGFSRTSAKLRYHDFGRNHGL